MRIGSIGLAQLRLSSEKCAKDYDGVFWLDGKATPIHKPDPRNIYPGLGLRTYGGFPPPSCKVGPKCVLSSKKYFRPYFEWGRKNGRRKEKLVVGKKNWSSEVLFTMFIIVFIFYSVLGGFPKGAIFGYDTISLKDWT